MRLAQAVVLVVGCVLLPGCINALAMGAKVFMGDPKTKSGFEIQTGIELQKGEHTLALVIDAPHRVTDDFDTLIVDLQDEVIHQLRRHGVNVANPDEVTRALERAPGGRFSAAHLAKSLDVDCILHVQIEQFTDSRSGNRSLLQSHSQGLVRGFEVRGEFAAPDRHVVEVYEESFHTLYPGGHPLPAEQTPRRTFLQKSIREMANAIGRQCYDVTTADLF